MKRWWAIAALLSLAACDKRGAPLAAYRNPVDAAASVLPLSLFGIYPCATLTKKGRSDVIVGISVDQCYKMLPARRYRGIWVDEFEGSQFFEGARDVKTVRARLNNRNAAEEWLGGPDAGDRVVPPRTSPNSRMIAIDFIGRRTAYPGRYGHMGMSRSEILVDRVIKARTIYQSNRSYLYMEAPVVDQPAK